MRAQPLWACGVIGLLTTTALAGDAFQFTRDVELPSFEQEELFSIRCDSAIYDNTQSALEDLRLLDGTGQPVPFLVRLAKTSRTLTTRRTWSANMMTARPLEDGGLEIIVTLDQDEPSPAGLKLITPLDNFEKRLRVETSADGRQWEEAAESPIFDYSRYVDVRQDSVAFSKTDHRHIRILIDNVTASQESELMELTRRLKGSEEIDRQEQVTFRRRPFRVDAVEFWQEITREVADSDMKQTYSTDGFRVEQDSQERQTHILIGMRQEPLTALTIETPDRNFSRRAIVEVQEVDGIQRKWRSLGQAILTHIDFKDIHREQLSINFPESRKRQYRIAIENRDSPPLEITGITAQGNIYEIVFLAQPEQNLHLIYGDPDAKPIEHDTQALQELLQAGYAPRSANLSEQQRHDAIEGTGAFQWPALVNNRIFLLAIITILVIVLGLGLYQASRRLDETPPDQPLNPS